MLEAVPAEGGRARMGRVFGELIDAVPTEAAMRRAEFAAPDGAR